MASYGIERYMIVIRQNAADIHLYSANNFLAGSIYFKPDNASLLPASQDPSGRIVLQYPLSQFSSVVDILRNEGAYIYYAIPSVAYIATGQEQTAEDEGIKALLQQAVNKL